MTSPPAPSKPQVIVVTSLVNRSKKVGVCLSCGYTTMPGTPEQAEQWGDNHLLASHDE